jgi:hypothetical protein
VTDVGITAQGAAYVEWLAAAGEHTPLAAFAAAWTVQQQQIERLRAALAEIAMSELLDAHAIAAREALGPHKAS